jgi:hypothetical protein
MPAIPIKVGQSLGIQPFQGFHTYETINNGRAAKGGTLQGPGFVINFEICNLETLLEVCKNRLQFLRSTLEECEEFEQAESNLLSAQQYLTRKIQKNLAEAPPEP